MYEDSVFSEPLSSFQFPVSPPTVEPNAAPLETIQVNSTWLQLLRGAAKQLLLQSTWKTTDPAVLNLAQERAFNLLGQLQDTAVTVSIPVGAIIQFGAASEPDGFLSCNGAAVSRSTYAALFAVIGTTFGVGDGTTTFNVPDFPDRTPIGDGSGSGRTSRTIGQVLGEETHVLTTAELASHAHQESYAPGPGQSQVAAYYHNGGGGNVFATIAGTIISVNTATPEHLDTQNSGSGTAHNNMQPSLVVHFIIKF